MEEKDDLMKNIINSETNNMKKYLVMGGATFVIFVVGIVIAKFAFGTSKDNTQVILPPDTNTKTQKDPADLFNSINVEKNDISVNKQNSKTEDKKDNSKDLVDNFKKPEPIDVEPIKENIKQNIDSKVQEVKTKIEEGKKQLEKAKKNGETIIKENLKPIVVNKESNSNNNSHHHTTSAKVRNYYIQVAAITRGEPSPKFLELIKQNHLNYKIREIDINGKKIKRVLVGPFSSDEVKNILPKVKQKITSSAFIKKLK